MSDIVVNNLKRKIILKKSNDILVIFEIDDIIFVEKADKNNIKIHYKGGIGEARMSLTYFGKIIGDQMFLRTHKSFIVNINEVSEIHDYFHNYLMKFKDSKETALITKEKMKVLQNIILSI